MLWAKILRSHTVERVKLLSRGGRVVNARALRARGSRGPQGFESLPRRHFFLDIVQWEEKSVFNLLALKRHAQKHFLLSGEGGRERRWEI